MRKSDFSSKDEPPLKRGSISLRVRYAETDAMGWVYYGTYLTYFEVGRTELIRSIWTSYRALEEQGMKLPVAEAHCRYHCGARYDDLLSVHTGLYLPSAFRIRFAYQISRDGDGIAIASGYSDHCFVSPVGKPIPLPRALMDAARS